MKKLIFSVFIVFLIVFAYACTSTNPASNPVPQNTGTITCTITPTSSITVTATVTPTSTALPKWYFDGSLEGWDITSSTYTAFTNVAYSTADYNSAPGSAAVTCSFTGTGGAATQTGRFFVDLTSQPVNISGMNGIGSYLYLPAGLVDQTPPYTYTAYLRYDAGWLAAGGASFTSAGGWSGWCHPVINSASFPAGTKIVTGIMYEIHKPDATPDFAGTIYFDTIRMY